jgi:predicted Holliday junction resolvase-like endonuclease
MRFPRIQKIISLYRHIFCACPCGCVFRLSDTQIIERAVKAPRDWLARLDFAINRLERKQERAEEAFEAKRDAIVRRERRRAQRLCDTAVCSVISNFKELAINSADVKTIFSPIRFVVFDGLSEREPRRIRFLDSPATTNYHEQLQRSVENTINRGNFEWSTIRVTDAGNVTRDR